MNNSTQAYRGSLFYFKEEVELNHIDPSKNFNGYYYIHDGLLIITDGKITVAGAYADLAKNLPKDTPITHYENCLITPGFIDSHVHAAQSLAVAAYGSKLLDWLENYIFPNEIQFANMQVAESELRYFFNMLLRNGTTTAVIYAPVQYQASELFFTIAAEYNMRVIAGKIMMDRNAPEDMLTSAEQNYDDTEKLIKKWHNTHRISYAITPRFAISCTPELMQATQTLVHAYPDVYVQTHLNENVHEIEQTLKLFPKAKNYLDVYQQYDLVNDRAIFGHCIHMEQDELALFQQSGATVSWCPISNNFLGSGLFELAKFKSYTNNITLASDWAAGNTVSMFSVLDDAYKVAMLQSFKLSTMTRWFMATLGSAKALKLADKIGSFATGKEADFIVIDPYVIPEIKHRSQTIKDIFELLFVIMTLGDSRNIKATYLAGKNMKI